MRKIRRSTKKRLIFFGVGILFLAGCFFSVFFLTRQSVIWLYQEEVQTLKEKLAEKERMAYVAVRDILPGEHFTEENVIKKQIYTDEDKNYFLDEEIFNKQAVFALPAGMHILKIFGTENSYTGETRECIFSEIALADILKTGDVVDVRIQYPNGENYCVLAGKTLYRNETDASESRFLLNEQEQLYVSSALYDKAVYDGTRLYAVRYVAASMQETSLANYVPVQDVVLQLYQAGTEREHGLWLREELENRLYTW